MPLLLVKKKRPVQPAVCPDNFTSSAQFPTYFAINFKPVTAVGTGHNFVQFPLTSQHYT